MHHHLASVPGNVHFGFYDAALPPVLTIAPGDTVTIETLSGGPEVLPPPAAGFALLPEHEAVLKATPRGPGPHLLTGPIAVDGARPGDALRIEIGEIKLRQDWAWNLIMPLAGALPDLFPVRRLSHPRIDAARGTIRMPWGLDLKAAPFFGCMGTAPPAAWGRQTSVIPRLFGGNIDCKDLIAGTVLHLPVFHEGGLFSTGDGHAAQGHGEVCLTAVETALTGTFRFTLEKDSGLAAPFAETPAHAITFGFDEDLDQAMRKALAAMIHHAERTAGLSAEDAYSLCSVAADLHVTQVVNIHKGVHAMLRHELLRAGN